MPRRLCSDGCSAQQPSTLHLNPFSGSCHVAGKMYYKWKFKGFFFLFICNSYIKLYAFSSSLIPTKLCEICTPSNLYSEFLFVLYTIEFINMPCLHSSTSYKLCKTDVTDGLSGISESRWRTSGPAGAMVLRSKQWCTPSDLTWWTWKWCGRETTGTI